VTTLVWQVHDRTRERDEALAAVARVVAACEKYEHGFAGGTIPTHVVRAAVTS
jgi:hypothetical protein